MKPKDKLKLLEKKVKSTKAEQHKLSKSEFDKHLFALMKVKPPKKEN